jgi:hypothetical protein
MFTVRTISVIQQKYLFLMGVTVPQIGAKLALVSREERTYII